MTKDELLATLYALAEGPCDQNTFGFAVGTLLGWLEHEGYSEIAAAMLDLARRVSQAQANAAPCVR
jgi:hypothetical protein